MKRIFFLIVCMLLSSSYAFAQGEGVDAVTQRKLDQIIKTQQQIQEQLQDLKTEVNIVKIRATR